MSLESAISDLVKSTNTLNTNVQNTLSTVNTQITKLSNNFIEPANKVLEIGPGKQFSSFNEAASYALNRFVKERTIEFKFADGTYNLNSLVINNFPFTVILTGNLNNPEKCVLDFNIPDANKYTHGILIIKSYVHIKGFKIKGYYQSDTNITFRCLHVYDNSLCYIYDSMIFEGGSFGLHVSSNSKVEVSLPDNKTLTFNNQESASIYCDLNSSLIINRCSNLNATGKTTKTGYFMFLSERSSISTTNNSINFNVSNYKYFCYIRHNSINQLYTTGTINLNNVDVFLYLSESTNETHNLNLTGSLNYALLQNVNNSYLYLDNSVSINIDMNSTAHSIIQSHNNAYAIINNQDTSRKKIFTNCTKLLYAGKGGKIQTTPTSISNFTADNPNITEIHNPSNVNTEGNYGSYIYAI